MSSRYLLLEPNGLFRLFNKRDEKSQEKFKKHNLIDAVRFAFSTCYIGRSLYWERIVHYPTTNLLEVRKIVQSEIDYISPVDGNTYAYIVNLSNKRTTVLYCCFPEAIVSKAKSYNLWRLLPETLPYYRYLFGKTGVYLSKLDLSALLINNKENNVEVCDTSVSNELLIKNDGENYSSLPVERENLDMFSTVMIKDADVIEQNNIEVIFEQFNSLKFIDLIAQVNEGIKGIVTKKGYLGRYFATVFLMALLTFIIGKSAFISWRHDYITNEITESKRAAVDSLAFSNQLKKITKDVKKINTSIKLQLSKAQLLNILSSLTTKDNGLEFSIIDIYSSEMQLRGTCNNAANLLTALSNIHGFNQVEFNSPPTSLKGGGERFFIKLLFDENIIHYQDKAKELVQ